jgi:hypothetical protein
MVARRIVLYVTAVLIGLALISPLFFEAALNSGYVKARIAGLIEKKTGTRIGPDQMTFEFSPHFSVRFEAISLPLTPDMGLHVSSVQMEPDLFQLLRGNIVISRILVEDLAPRFLRKQDTAAAGPLPFPAVKFPTRQIQNLFALFPDNQKHLELVLTNSQTDHFSSLTGTMWISKPDQAMQLDVRIHDFHMTGDRVSRFLSGKTLALDQVEAPFVRMHARLDAQDGVSGQINLDRFKIVSGRLPETPVSGPALTLSFAYSAQKISVNLDSTDLAYPSGQVSVAFSHIFAREKTVIEFTGSDIDIAQARDVSVAMAPQSRVVHHLFDILRHGTADDVSVKFQSASIDTLFNPRQMTLEGSARNARVKIPQTPLVAMDVDGNARVVDGMLHIDAFNGRVGRTPLHKGRLDIDLMNHTDVTFTGTFDLDVNLSEVPGILISLLPETELAKEMTMVTQVEGQVDVRLELGLETGQKDLSVSVTTGPFSGTGNYERIPFPITISKGNFHYENGQVRLTGMSGSIGANAVTDLTARVDMVKDLLLDLSVGALDVNIQELWPELKRLTNAPSFLDPVTQVSGRLIFDRFFFNGPMFFPDQGTWDLSGSGQGIQVGFSSDTPQIQELSGVFDISEKSVAARDLKATMTHLDWLPIQKISEYTADIAMPLVTEAGEISMDRQKTTVSTRVMFAPGIRLFIQLTGLTPNDLKPQTLTLEHRPLTDAIVRFDWDPQTPLIRFEGKLDTRTLDNMLIKSSFLDQLLLELTGNQPVSIHTDPHMNLHVDTPFLRLNSVVSDMFSKNRLNGKSLLDHDNLHLKTDRLVYKKYQVSEVQAVILWDMQQTDIQLLSANLCGLDLAGRLTFSQQKPGIPTQVDIDIQAVDQENIASTLSCFFPDLRLLNGSYSFQSGLAGNGPLQRIPKSLSGDLSFEAHNGQIHKMTLLSRLLSVLNILKLPDITQEGFRYKNILVEGQMENGVIHLEKAVIDAENMALFFTGRVYPFENKLNLTCLVAPLKTIDTIIQFIPIVNTILSGRLVSFPAKATGAIDDPVITPMHPSAVGEGLINLFTGILQTPLRLLDGTP